MASPYTSNKNVLYTLIFSVLDGASSSIRSGDVLSVLVYMHSHSKKVVGNLVGAAGKHMHDS